MTDRLTWRVPEVAQMLGVSRSLVYEWVDKGYIAAIRPGGGTKAAVLIRDQDLHAFLEREAKRAQ